MIGRRRVLLATAGIVTFSGCSSTGGGEGDTSISSPSCSSSSHFKLVESSYDPIPSMVDIEVELLAFENIGNQPVYDVDVKIDSGSSTTFAYNTPQKWDAGTRFQVTDMGEVDPDASIVVSGSLRSGETVSEEACI